MDSRFGLAFEEALGHDLDRRILIKLLRADREVRYEELRKAVGEDSKQTFKYAVDRLMRRAVVGRRLEEQGDRYLSYFSLTPRGRTIATILSGLGEGGSIPEGVPAQARKAVQGVFLGETGPEPA